MRPSCGKACTFAWQTESLAENDGLCWKNESLAENDGLCWKNEGLGENGGLCMERSPARFLPEPSRSVILSEARSAKSKDLRYGLIVEPLPSLSHSVTNETDPRIDQ
jgi:hypothetical protein